jgi:hypothetical protein
VKTTLAMIACTAVAAAFAANATAARKQLWYDPKVDAVASDVAGTSVRVDGEDDLAEWASFVTPDDPYAVLGFTFPFATPSSALYHRIFITPELWPTLRNAVEYGPQNSQSSLYGTAVAIFTMTHEAYHIRLLSGDENRVNACALQAFPTVVTKEFGVPAADTRTSTVPVTKTVRVKYKARVHRRWVTRYRWKTVTTYTTTTSSVPNATYTSLVSAAHDFYSHQDATYNTGTCW